MLCTIFMNWDYIYSAYFSEAYLLGMARRTKQTARRVPSSGPQLLLQSPVHTTSESSSDEDVSGNGSSSDEAPRHYDHNEKFEEWVSFPQVGPQPPPAAEQTPESPPQ